MRKGEELVKYICQLKYEDLPQEVVHQAKRAMLDIACAMLCGSREEEARKILAFIKEIDSEGNSTIIGTNETCGYIWSSFVNACFAQIHDCNDGHREAAAFGAAAHPGRSVIPVALAVGEKFSLSGKDILTAIVVGYDVAVRIRALGEKPPAAAYSSAAVAGKLMGLSEEEMYNAIGIAGYNSPLKCGNLMTYMIYDTNFICNGYTASIGIEAALLAKQGLSGPPIEDDSKISTRFIDRGLGKEFEIMNIYFKPYPTCRMTHGTIEAILKMKSETFFSPSDVDEVKILQVSGGMYVAEKQVNTQSPYKLCEFNLPYIAACAITDGKVGIEQFKKERIADPEIHELIKKVRVESDESMNIGYPEKHRPCQVNIKLKDGRLLSKRINLPKGDATIPLSDDELYEKFYDWTKEFMPEGRAQKIRDEILKFNESNDIKDFMGLLKI